MRRLSVLTLNLARPTADRARPLLEYLWHRPEDLLVLTEVGRGAGSNLVAAVCKQAGYTVIDSRAGDYGVLLISRTGTLDTDLNFPRPDLMPDRVAAARWDNMIRIVGVYGAASDPVRYSSQKQRQRKRDWLESFDCSLGAADLHLPALLIGDLNLVAPGYRDRLPYVLAEETAFYRSLQIEHHLTDAYAAAHNDDGAVTWVDHSGVGCRYDHAFVTSDLVAAVTDCHIDHTPREEGRTDHSALSITLELE
ncbi:endonuclease/exonuclease/phosphatase family protein [Antrihabitans cavernicola]|uniref:Endonuclease/exonuclease/phosphatase domain-containing protein n=1 Tax=Antrihabitans cavernicola TaxID=2495913 RepID=A0A5A7S7W2_9NOCA|nr:endonuclease/exonuclease/phosphatase family protein [Spelaeibacter cavernicola]KAA0019470.1 hypothetical protein FOY51_22765 [Spelaeibacter cavernicola]